MATRMLQATIVIIIIIRHTSGISGGFRQLRNYDSAVMANFGTFVMRPKEDTARDWGGGGYEGGGRHLPSLGSLSADSFH